MAIEVKPAFQSAIADNPADLAAGYLTPSRWNAAMAWSGLTTNALLYSTDATTPAQSANLTYSETSGPRLQVGGTTAAAGITITGGTITANSNPFLITTTRNAAGVTFDAAIKAVITDTASAAGSLAMQILGGPSGTTNLFSVGKAGTVDADFFRAAGANGFQAAAGAYFFWSGRSQIRSSANSLITLENSAGNDFDRLTFGGVTSSYPALKRSTTVLQARLADDSAAGTFEGKFNSSDGTAGATAGPFTVITGITVKDGIVTSLTGS